MLVADIFIKTKSYINQPENSHQENNIGCAPFLTSSTFTDWLITWLKSVSSFILSHQRLSIFFNGIFSYLPTWKSWPSSVELSRMGRGRSRRGTSTTAATRNQPLMDSLTPITSGKIIFQAWLKLKTNKHNGCNYEPAPNWLTYTHRFWRKKHNISAW